MKTHVFTAVLAALATATTAAPSLSCSLHPGGVGERQEVVCALHGDQAAASAASTLLLLLPLPPSIAPDSAWLAAAAPAGTGGVVSCGDEHGPPPTAGSIGPCPALSGDGAPALAACVPPPALTTPVVFHLTSRLSTACADEAVAAKARPALVVARGNAGGSFRVAVRGRLAAPDPAASLRGAPAAVALPPPLLAAFHPSNGSLAGVVARAAGAPPLTWDVPAPGCGGAVGVGVGLVTAAAAVAATATMVRAAAGGGRSAAKAA